MDISYHYPPELFQLLVDAIPRLCRSKKDVLLFFRGAGVEVAVLSDLQIRLREEPKEIGKFEMVRTVLQRINEAGEPKLRERREVLKRVVEFEDFSTCWPNDRLPARGFVAEIRRVVNVKDSFTRMKQERETEVNARVAEKQHQADQIAARTAERESLRKNFYRLFGMDDVGERGRQLESALNNLFAADGIQVREAFRRVGESREGVVEQIDGVVELDGEIYLAEMKWLQEPAGVGDVSQHLVRIFGRQSVRGLFISYSGYSEPAISQCRDALSQRVVIMCTLHELVQVLESDGELKTFLKAKVNGSLLDKNPFKNVLD